MKMNAGTLHFPRKAMQRRLFTNVSGENDRQNHVTKKVYTYLGRAVLVWEVLLCIQNVKLSISAYNCLKLLKMCIY